MTWFDRNIKALLTHNRGLNKEYFYTVAANPHVKIVQSACGLPTATYDDKYIHSRRDPYKEAEDIIAAQVPSRVTVGIFYGMGLGYLPEAFRARYPDIDCLVIEPDISVFVAALAARDLRSVLSARNVTFLLATEPEQTAAVLERYALSCVQIIKLRSLFEKDREYYTRLDYTIEYFMKKREVNKNTLRRFGKLWIRNLCANIRTIARAPGIERVTGVFKGLPALVIAAGPSLNGLLPALKQLADKMVVIAVDTSLAVCQENGIQPDFVVVADPQYWNTRHLDYARPDGFILISESATNPRVFRKLHAPMFLGGSLFPLGRYLESVIGMKGKLGAGGSVATTAWDFARISGANPIMLAGLDLGYPFKQTHYRGSYFENQFFNTCSRWRPAEGLSFRYLYSAGPLTIPANNNDVLLSDQRMVVYKYWFETQAKLHPQVRCKNLSAHGAQIQGIPYCDYTELLNLENVKERIREKTEFLKSVKTDMIAARNLDKLKGALRELILELESLQELARDGKKATIDFKRRLQDKHDTTEDIRTLDNIDEKLLAASSRSVVGFLIQPLINEITDAQFTNENKDLVLEYSKKMYAELFNSCSYQLEILKKTLQTL
jgi:hypothetical protein